MKLIITYLLITILSFTKFGISTKVAIIGKGNGAALCSYFLHRMIPGIEIDIYNHQSAKNTFSPSVFHSSNAYIEKIMDGKKTSLINITNKFTIKDGDKFHPLGISNVRTHDDCSNRILKKFLLKQLENFNQIYTRQKDGKSFRTVRELLKSLSKNLESYYKNGTTEDLLKICSLTNNPDIREFMKAELVSHYYNSNLNAHKFAGLALLIFSKLTGEHKKEDKNLAKLLFDENNDNIVEKDVSIILRKNNQNYVVAIDGDEVLYDFIILATPTANKISYNGFADTIKIFGYLKAYTTYLNGNLSDKFQNIAHSKFPIIDIKMNLMYLKTPSSPPHDLYSITGSENATDSVISEYVKSVVSKTNYDFNVCPDYTSKDKSVRDAKFELGVNLYNAHALHSLHMGNEMLAIGAKNIALLIQKELSKKKTSGKRVIANTVANHMSSLSSVIGKMKGKGPVSNKDPRKGKVTARVAQ